MICFLNGKFIPLQKAGVGLYDLGILRGYTIFEVMRTYNGKLFMYADHYKRFQNSAKEMGMRISYSQNELDKKINRILAKNRNGGENVVRVVMTGGISKDTMHMTGKPTFYILVEPFIPLPVEVYEKGISIPTREFQRNIPEAKTANYIQGVQVLNKNKDTREVLFIKDNKVLEASTSNLFIAKGGKVITPINNILHGITRKVVISFARKHFRVEERDISKKELFSADEAFLTATNKKIVPVVKIDSKKIGNGRVGNTTKQLMDLFDSYVSKY